MGCPINSFFPCPYPYFYPFLSLPIVFNYFYHGPTLATNNSTRVLLEIKELMEKAANATERLGSRTSDGAPVVKHVTHVFLPESLVLCTRERPILCLLLMLGTLWLGYALYQLRRR